MNNEVLEKYNELLPFNSSADAATALKIFTSSVGPGFKSLKDKTVELSAAHTVDTRLVRDDPTVTENYIRDELARKIAKQLIEEDLIQIQSDEDINDMKTTFRAQVKVIQE